jgi:hypothetical protein
VNSSDVLVLIMRPWVFAIKNAMLPKSQFTAQIGEWLMSSYLMSHSFFQPKPGTGATAEHSSAGGRTVTEHRDKTIF